MRLLRTIGASALSGALFVDSISLGVEFASAPISCWLTPDVLIGPLYFGTIYGSLAGVVAGPLLRYTLLRRVPASRAIAWSLIGTAGGLWVGAAFGWYLLDGATGFGALVGGAIALPCSSLILWWTHRPSKSHVAF